MANAKNFWVIGKRGGWAVKREGSSRAISIHTSKQRAWRAARDWAKEEGFAAILQGIDGRVAEYEDFGASKSQPTRLLGKGTGRKLDA
jgi:hypothetical protein